MTSEPPAAECREEFSLFSTLPWLVREPNRSFTDQQHGFADILASTTSSMTVRNDGMSALMESVSRLENEVSGISNRLLVLESAYAEEKEESSTSVQRLLERVSTMEGRQSSIQSKMSQLDNVFGATAQSWGKGAKTLKEILLPLADQRSSRSESKKGGVCKSEQQLIVTAPRALDTLQAVGACSTSSEQTSLGICHPELKTEVDYPVSKRELYSKLSLFTESINTLQMEFFEVMAGLQSSLGTLDNKVNALHAKEVSSCVSSLPLHAEEKIGDVAVSIPMVSLLSLNRVGQHSYILKSYAADVKYDPQQFNNPLSPYSSYIDKILEKERHGLSTTSLLTSLTTPLSPGGGVLRV